MRGVLSHNIGALKPSEHPRAEDDASHRRPLTVDSARAALISGNVRSGPVVASSVQKACLGDQSSSVTWDRCDVDCGAGAQSAIDLLASALLRPSAKTLTGSPNVNLVSLPEKGCPPTVKHTSTCSQVSHVNSCPGKEGAGYTVLLKSASHPGKAEVSLAGSGYCTVDDRRPTTEAGVLLGKASSDVRMLSRAKSKGGKNPNRQKKRQEGQASVMTVSGKRVCVHEKAAGSTLKDQTVTPSNIVLTASGSIDSSDSSQATGWKDNMWEEGKRKVTNPLSVVKLKVHQRVDDGDAPLPLSAGVPLSKVNNFEGTTGGVNSTEGALCNGAVAKSEGGLEMIASLAQGNDADQDTHSEESTCGEAGSKDPLHLPVDENGMLGAQRRLSSGKKPLDFKIQNVRARLTGELTAASVDLSGGVENGAGAAYKAEEINEKTMEVLDNVFSVLTVTDGGAGRFTEAPCVRPISSHLVSRDKHQTSAPIDKIGIDSTMEEKNALMKYLEVSDLDLSMSTFKQIGSSLRLSETLRVLNLKGCTAGEEDLRGLSEVGSLQVVCVSHMRNLTSLTPLATRPDGLSSNIREIDARCSSVRNAGLLDLDKMRYLRKLNLSLTPVTNVTLLVGSTSLAELNLAGTAVTSDGLLGLEKMPLLTSLNLSRTKVKSLRRISESPMLENLNLYSCRVCTTDVRGVEGMPRLKSLDLSTTKVSDLSFLSSSSSLRTLRAQWLVLRNCDEAVEARYSRRNFSGNETKMFDFVGNVKENKILSSDTDTRGDTDVEAGVCGLAKIPTLEFVDLSYSSVTSVRSLFCSKSIETIVLRRTPVDDDGIKDIGQLQTLKTLVINNLGDLISTGGEGDLSNTKGVLVSVRDITMAFGVVILDLSFTDVYDLRAITSLKSMKELYLVETLITVDGIRGVEQLPALRLLDISQTSVVTVDFLSEGCNALEKLYVKSNRNATGFRIGKIFRLPSLSELDVSDTVVEDISMLFHSKCMIQRFVCRWGERRVANGPTESLAPWLRPALFDGMDVLSRLETVDLTNSTLRSVTFLAGSRSLRRITLARCSNLSNNGISGLVQIPTLEALDLSFCPRITDVRSIVSSFSLKELRLAGSAVTADGLHGVLQMKSLGLLDVTGTPACDALAGAGVDRSELVVIRDGEVYNMGLPSRFRRCRKKPVVILSQ